MIKKKEQSCRAQAFHFQDFISNSPYYLPYMCYNISTENLVLDQPKIP